jgi:hypothetical protein
VEKNEIAVGEDYAYLAPGVPGPHEPLKATVITEPEGGYIKVALYHPDAGQSEERVKTRELVGRWDDEPEARYGQHTAAIESAHERGEKWTWADIAAKRYGEVQRQRSLADRLSRLGIRRAGRNYASKGGSSIKPHDTDLQLNYDEIEYLLTRAESGPGAVLPAGLPEPTDTNEEES